MKKLLSMLLAISLMVSMLTVGSYAAESASPTIIRAVAINDTQFKITTDEAITVKNAGCFALFAAKNGVVENLTERDGRFGGAIEPVNTAATEFIWTINAGGNATHVINEAVGAGHKVYFGLNGSDASGMIDVARVVDSEGKGFVPNLPDNHDSHGIYAVEVTAFALNTIVSVRAVSDTHLEIEFARPLVSFAGAVLLGVLDTAETVIYNDDGVLDDHAVMTYKIEEGKLVCWLEQDKAGMSGEDARNITRFVAAVKAAYPGHCAGIGLLEANADSIKNTGRLEQALDTDGIPLKATGTRSGRDLCVAAISVGVAEIGDTPFFSLEDAMANAAAGDEIDLLDDVTATDGVFVLDAGVVLDLNGYELAVNHVMTFGDIIDSTEGTGKLVPAAHARVILNTENSAMPLYDTDGFRFFTYDLKSAGPNNGTADAVSFGVQLTFTNIRAYDLLAKDAAAVVEMDLSVTKENKVTNLTFTFKQETLEKYKEAWNNRTDLSKTPTLVLTVSGIRGVSSISCTPGFSQTATTVCQTGAVLTYPAAA